MQIKGRKIRIMLDVALLFALILVAAFTLVTGSCQAVGAKIGARLKKYGGGRKR